MAFSTHQANRLHYQKKLTLNSSFDDIFQDYINPVYNHQESRGDGYVEPRASPHNIAISCSASNDSDLDFEDALYSALVNYLQEDDASMPQQASSDPDQKSAQEPQFSTDFSLTNISSSNGSPSLQDVLFTSALDTFLPSPPQSPSIDSFQSLSDRSRPHLNSSSVQEASSGSCRSTTTPMLNRHQNDFANLWEDSPQRMLQTINSAYLSPPPSASYQQLHFPGSGTIRIDTPLPTSHGAHPNTPVENSFFTTPSTSFSSLDELDTLLGLPQGSPATAASAVSSSINANIHSSLPDMWCQNNTFKIPVLPSRVVPFHSHKINNEASTNVPQDRIQTSYTPYQFMPSPSLSQDIFTAFPQHPFGPAITPYSMATAPEVYGSMSANNGLIACSALPNSPIIFSPMPRPPQFDPNQRWLQAHPESPRMMHSGTFEAADLSPKFIASTKTRTKSPRRQDIPRSAVPNHRRSKSMGQIRRKSAAASSKSPRQASDGFVNWGVDDSATLLSGVAPSGSSNTKAKREREAAEKRRRTVEAAKKLLEQAGGDVHRFEQELEM